MAQIANDLCKQTVLRLFGQQRELDSFINGRFTQLLLCPGNRVTLPIEQILEPQYKLDILLLVKPLLFAALTRAEGTELRFPVTQDVRLDPGKFGYFTDLEI